MNRRMVCWLAAFALSGNCDSRFAVADVVATWPFTGSSYAPMITGTPIAGLLIGNISVTSPSWMSTTTGSSTTPVPSYPDASKGPYLDTQWNKIAFSANASGSIGFTVTNDSVSPVQLTGFAFGIRNSGSGPPTYSLRYRINGIGGFTDEAASGSISSSNSSWFYKSHTDLTLSLPVGSVAEFRLYGYGGSGPVTQNNIRIDDVRAVFTAVASVPEASAWAMGGAAVVAAWGAARFGRTNR
ncbi:MAG: hypothetical protein KF688_00095 [Pirellulales bacterium]|nr:hypothetical protein [Pirellulales bacterium]